MNKLARMTRRRRTLTVGAAAFAMAASGAMVASQALAPPPAHNNGTSGLKAVGPISETNGFPVWYQDTSGTRLELCTDPGDANCIVGAPQTPGAPIVFPTNFPDEAFYSNAGASLSTGTGTAKLVTGVEAAFAGAGTPAAKQQITFGRIRIVATGLADGADYTVTNPYGKNTFTAEAGTRGIFDTQDIGSLTPDGKFDQTLGAEAAPFLKWPTGTGAPAGYLGDPAVDHAVTGSPNNTNFFRITGPVGSFTGSTDLCADPTLGPSSTSTTDCIETSLFQVAGKVATHGGVQVTKAYYQVSGAGNMMDLFAYSTPGQNLVVSGTGVSDTKMREDAAGNGKYYARVYADGAPPTDLKVTNTTDTPDSVDHVEQAQFGDRVHVDSAVYSTDTQKLTVTAESGDPAAALSVQGFSGGAPSLGANGATTWTFANLPVPPDDVTVTSDKGGVGTEDVVITGADTPAADVVATIVPDTTSVQVGQTITLDGTTSAGTITGSAFSMTPATGATLTGTGLTRTFQATTPGSYIVKLTVTGAGTGNTSTDTVTIVASDANAAPVADAGPDQLGVVPTSVVTLDGSGSKFASTYSWAQSSTDAVQLGAALKNPTTANPTFTVPASSTPLTFNFTLTITDVNGSTAKDTMQVTTDPGAVTVDSASYKQGSTEWRVRGSAKYCSANNVISVYWNKPAAGTTPASSVLVGTTSPTLALGVCSYDFRLKNAPTALRPTAAGTVTVRSAYGGEALDQAFQLL
ncbi:MAG TPA: hypothetical protein VIH10_01320 [Kribbella sp.]